MLRASKELVKLVYLLLYLTSLCSLIRAEGPISTQSNHWSDRHDAHVLPSGSSGPLPAMTASLPDGFGLNAAAYVRMSTEHQQYSTSNQMDVLTETALKRGFQIVKTYSDDGKSGLKMQGRDALRQLLLDVQTGTANFRHILVYDVSRWGRFQDADESAHYEFICRLAGITVHYCAEQFENDGSPVSTIVKGVKRAMAGEYSRELSAKVFQGACRLIQLGYKQGGTAGFGLRRMLVDQAGVRKTILKFGEQKSIQTDRVILILGPENEVETVRSMYRAFVEGKKLESEIAAELNASKILTDSIVHGHERPSTKSLRMKNTLATTCITARRLN